MVLAGGATAWRDLPIPGRELDGIHQAMEFLPWANRVQQGDPVVDDDGSRRSPRRARRSSSSAAATPAPTAWAPSHRQGAASVHQFEIMPRPPETRADSTPWPIYPLMFRVSSAHEEGGERVYSVNTEEFVGDATGSVTGLRGARGRDGRRASSRRSRAPTSSCEADLVLLAMGFVGPERAGLLTDLGVEITERGNVARDADFATTVPGVFVAGDMGRGQSLIVWAIAEGRAAAAGVDRYLMGSTALPAPIKPTAAPQR